MATTNGLLLTITSSSTMDTFASITINYKNEVPRKVRSTKNCIIHSTYLELVKIWVNIHAPIHQPVSALPLSSSLSLSLPGTKCLPDLPAHRRKDAPQQPPTQARVGSPERRGSIDSPASNPLPGRDM